MKVVKDQSVESQKVEMEGASGCSMRLLLSDSDGAPNFTMRQFEVQPGGHTPLHHHPYEHEVFVIAGSGVAVEGNTEHPIAVGDVIFAAPDDVHQFRNTGDVPMKFLCLVPNTYTQGKVTVVADCCAD